jgi:hypothetical protein
MELPKEMAEMIAFIPLGVSTTRIALNFARMTRSTGYDQAALMSINPVLFKSQAVCKRALVLLQNNGMVMQLDNGNWVATSRGHLAIDLLRLREPSISDRPDLELE